MECAKPVSAGVRLYDNDLVGLCKAEIIVLQASFENAYSHAFYGNTKKLHEALTYLWPLLDKITFSRKIGRAHV